MEREAAAGEQQVVARQLEASRGRFRRPKTPRGLLRAEQESIWMGLRRAPLAGAHAVSPRPAHHAPTPWENSTLALTVLHQAPDTEPSQESLP